MMLPRFLILSALAVIALSGCSDVRESLGMGRSAPDEFTVIDRPPLSLPPDFALRPPKPGAPRPQEVDITKRANDILFAADASGKPVADNNTPSDSEKALLATTGATKADPNIREIVDHEASEKVVGSEHLVDELLWWKRDESSATTVDAPAEAARIKDAKSKGDTLNQSATPVIERQKSSWLGL